MATKLNRFIAICNALTDGTATAGQMEMYGRALANSAIRGQEYIAATTNDAKASIAMDILLARALGEIDSLKRMEAAAVVAPTTTI